MTALGLAISYAPSNSSEPPTILQDSRVVNSEIIISTRSKPHQAAVTTLLYGQPGVKVVATAEGRLRLRMGVPGNLARIPGEQLDRFFFDQQNLKLSVGSLKHVSLLPGPHPTAFFDADQSAQNYLNKTGWTL